MDIWTRCHTDNGYGLSFGTEADSLQDEDLVEGAWIIEGVGDYLYENYEFDEYDKAVEAAAEKACAVLIEHPEEDIPTLAYKTLGEVLGHFSIVYEVDDKEAELQIDADIDDYVLTYLQDYVVTEIKDRINR